MSKGLNGFLLLLIILFAISFYYADRVRIPTLALLDTIKIRYNNIVEKITHQANIHTYQSKHIIALEEKLLKYENNHIIMQQFAHEINDLFKKHRSSLKVNPKVELIRTISYKKLGNLNKIWLDIENYNPLKIYGLTYNEYVAGIVINDNGRALGLLNQDTKSTYAVYVGSGLAPGIAQGQENEANLIVKFIPAWLEIKKGDIVITSGLDNIFFKGLKVGQVVSVHKSKGYKNAIMEPYYKANNPNYFYMIKNVR